MLTFVLQGSGDEKALAVKGDLTIVHAGELRDALAGAFAGASKVDIDLEGVTGVDLSGLQLISSAWKSAACMGKGVRLSACSEVFLSAAETAGFKGQLEDVWLKG
jgi:anti-anti-sigma regulatory factor